MVKLNLKEILAFKPRRAGFAATGSPTNINVGRTMRNSHGRRIALKRPKREELDAIAAGDSRPWKRSRRARRQHQRIAALQRRT